MKRARQILLHFSYYSKSIIFAAHWRGSSVGKSAGFITLRSRVQLPISLLKRPQTRAFFIYEIQALRFQSHNEFGEDWTAPYRPCQVWEYLLLWEIMVYGNL
jgi:hypothetical protein